MKSSRPSFKHVALLTLAGVVIFATLVLFFWPRTPQTPQSHAPESAPISISVGKPAAHTITVYVDPLCPRCREYHQQTLQPIYEQYVRTGKAQLVVRPVAFISEYSASLNEYSLCANQQGKYWQALHHTYELIARSGSSAAASFYTNNPPEQLASAIGVDAAKLGQCLEHNDYLQQQKQQLDHVRTHGITGTPSTFVDTHPIVRGAVPLEFITNLLRS